MKKLILTSFLLLQAQAAAAATSVYDCEVKPNGNDAWIPAAVHIEHDENSGDVLVADPIIYHFNERRPVPAKVATNNSKRTTFVWKIKGVKNKTGQRTPAFHFRATYYKQKGTFVVTSRADGYTDKFRGSGRCKVTSQ